MHGKSIRNNLGNWDLPLLNWAHCVISFTQCTPVKISMGGSMLDVWSSRAIITVAPHFSLSTCTALPTCLIPVGAISVSQKGWNRRKVLSALTTASTYSSLNFPLILALFSSAFWRQPMGTLCAIVIFQTDHWCLFSTHEMNFWNVFYLPFTKVFAASLSQLREICCCTIAWSCSEARGAPHSQ